MINEKNIPLVSAGIPAYNHEKYIAECIESVINQDYENMELIIINDGSNDKTHDVIMSYDSKCKKRFVRYEYRNRENHGLTATLNEMVDWAKGKYFTLIASDDVMLSDKVSTLVDKLESLDESYAVAFGDAIFIDKKGNKVYLDKKTGKPDVKNKGCNLFLDYHTYRSDIDYRDEKVFGAYATLLKKNYLPAMSNLIRLDKVKEVGAWIEGNTIEDWELWLKLAKKYKFVYAYKPVAMYRLHGENITKTMSKYIYNDYLMLLKKEKEYAISKNLDQIYYISLAKAVLEIRKYSYKTFFNELLSNLGNSRFYIYFIKYFLYKLFIFLII